ncbi:ring canal kelch homolog isoform X1 [Metopolophium dirhodum]|uniref:ring canal kelch homolog isoform X1 n=1 Tax=Metopolophium dirhodum TaxID=44670 RepID=UPI00298FACCE|nr:ring canal kelch homolog isoform X1 [Metopolophium dirhodum]
MTLLFHSKKKYTNVISWVNHELYQRKDCLPELMEHVRLPLLKYYYYLKNTSKCKDNIFYALQFHLQKSVHYIGISMYLDTIRCKPRQFGDSQKVILMFSRSNTSHVLYRLHYQLQNGITQQPNYERNAPGINDCRQTPGLGVIRDQFVFVAGGVNKSSLKSKMYAMMESILKEFIDQVMDLIFLIWSYADFVLE